MEHSNNPEMPPPDYIGAHEYAHKRLTDELLHCLHYHNVYHSFGEVLLAVLFLANQVGIVESDLQLLKVAAAFHDIGWVVQGNGHENIGVEICSHILPAFSFSGMHIYRNSGMIPATRLLQTPQNELEEILADADMFTLGSDDFWPRNSDLRYEIEALGEIVSDKEAYQSQLDFLKIYQYHTIAAQKARDHQKKEYIAELSRPVSQNGRLDGPAVDRLLPERLQSLRPLFTSHDHQGQIIGRGCVSGKGFHAFGDRRQESVRIQPLS